MPDVVISLLSIGSGAIVSLVLGLVGGGGSVLAVPLLVYAVGVSPPHVAIGTSAIAVSVSAFANLLPHARLGNVRWRCAVVFAGFGVAGALLGAEFAKAYDGEKLMILFGLLMVIVGLLMLRKRAGDGDVNVHLTADSVQELLPYLGGIGFSVGTLSGFFGIGGGFMIVPGLILATGMPLTSAVGTSLVAVSAFGAATATSYAVSGLIDWSVAGLFVLGGLGGGAAGAALGRYLEERKRALGLVFAAVVISTGIYVVARGTIALTAI